MVRLHQVRDPILIHDSWATQLVVGRINIYTHELVESLVSRENNGRGGSLLNCTLTETDQVCSNANSSVKETV
jgi:hypothetical protein